MCSNPCGTFLAPNGAFGWPPTRYPFPTVPFPAWPSQPQVDMADKNRMPQPQTATTSTSTTMTRQITAHATGATEGAGEEDSEVEFDKISLLGDEEALGSSSTLTQEDEG